ncbi:LamG-like jellyroll fold domain-containing protein [Botrimarina sp.]|uniref:LamG-like jellyroll fold domain-containing protein n=1 Tax=Botrimarina sp. TaxID=2795802 RepID=UPI0032EC7E5C
MPSNSQEGRWRRVSREAIRLISQLTDGSLSESDAARLRQILAHDDDTLAYYVRWFDLHAALHDDLVRSGFDPFTLARRSRRRDQENAVSKWLTRHATRWAPVALAVAATGLVAIAWRAEPTGVVPVAQSPPITAADGFQRLDNPSIQRFREKDSETIAVVTKTLDARWGDRADCHIGSALGRGRLRLTRGVAQIEFLSGANVVLEAPAEIELQSAMAMRCVAGKIRANVPNPAIGFVVETPSKRVVDLGTEFAVRVGAGGDEVHVLDGEVRLEPSTSAARSPAADEPQILRIGQAIRTDRGGSTSLVNASPIDFLGRQRLAELASRESTSRVAQWQDYRSRLKADESVVLNYGFNADHEWQRMLLHDGPHAADSLEGAIVGCQWSEGRWPWKRALEFKRLNDRVRLSIPGEYESVTFSCWLRIDGFDRWLSSILLTDGHELGEPHWQFTETGQLLLGVKAGDVSSDYLSPSVLRLLDVGRWLHVACVYDGGEKRVTHYLDGKPVARLPIEEETKIRFGAAEIGNWVGEGFVDHTVRSLNGRIDELLLFSRPLSGKEIGELYVQGRP